MFDAVGRDFLRTLHDGLGLSAPFDHTVVPHVNSLSAVVIVSYHVTTPLMEERRFPRYLSRERFWWPELATAWTTSGQILKIRFRRWKGACTTVNRMATLVFVLFIFTIFHFGPRKPMPFLWCSGFISTCAGRSTNSCFPRHACFRAAYRGDAR